nr:type II toxin-antitoxin system HicA family toxin [Hyella patelloides]
MFVNTRATQSESFRAFLGRIKFARVARQRGSHIRLEKKLPDETLKITVPAHRPVKRSTLAKILKQARIDLDNFLKLL